MEIDLKLEYRDLTMNELTDLCLQLQGLAGGKIYSIKRINIPENKENKIQEQIYKAVRETKDSGGAE